MLNLIPGASQDGSSVYFVANGVLAPGADRDDACATQSEAPPAGATSDLYVSNRLARSSEHETKFVAGLV